MSKAPQPIPVGLVRPNPPPAPPTPLSHLLAELLAVIHRDGGHYLAKHGVAKAVEDAITVITTERSLR